MECILVCRSIEVLKTEPKLCDMFTNSHSVFLSVSTLNGYSVYKVHDEVSDEVSDKVSEEVSECWWAKYCSI